MTKPVRSDESGGGIELDPPPARAVPCCMCGRFTSVKTARQHADMGDYGQVYSVEFECPSCVKARR